MLCRSVFRKRGHIFLFLLGASVAVAQLPTATILGVTKDSSGAVVPNVAVTARNVETGQTRTTVSGADGAYRLAALPVGTYEVRVEHPGFATQMRSGLTMTVAQEAVFIEGGRSWRMAMDGDLWRWMAGEVKYQRLR